MAGEHWICGTHPVRAALTDDPQHVAELRLAGPEPRVRHQQLVALAEAAAVPVHIVSRRELDRLTGSRAHQGAAAWYRPPRTLSEADLMTLVGQAGDGALVLALDGVTDPHNLGACLRTADAAGVTAVVIPRDRAAGLTPVVCKVASGAAGRVALAVVTNLSRCLRRLKEVGTWVIGTAGEADTGVVYKVDLTGPLVIVVGAEGHGLRRLTRATCDRMVRIPMAAAGGSLNVSVAAGVMLFEVRRQRLALDSRVARNSQTG